MRKLVKISLAGALVAFSAPAHASWLCFNDGSGCYEFPDGGCSQSAGVQRLVAKYDMSCHGPIVQNEDTISLSQLLSSAETTKGGAAGLKRLQSIAKQMK